MIAPTQPQPGEGWGFLFFPDSALLVRLLSVYDSVFESFPNVQFPTVFSFSESSSIAPDLVSPSRPFRPARVGIVPHSTDELVVFVDHIHNVIVRQQVSGRGKVSAIAKAWMIGEGHGAVQTSALVVNRCPKVFLIDFIVVVKILPQGPDAVYVGVVDKEERIAGAERSRHGTSDLRVRGGVRPSFLWWVTK